MNTFNDDLPSMNSERYLPAAVTHGRRIFVLGGDNAGTVEMFDINTKRWTTIASRSELLRRYCAAVTLGDDIVMMGNGSADQYNVVSNQWSPFPPMNISRIGFAADVLDGKIIVVGGYADEGLATVEEYDPSTGEWRELPSMHCKREYCATAVLDGKLYVMGGLSLQFDDVYGDYGEYGEYNSRSQSSAEVYDPATQQWTLLDDMSTSRSGCAAVPLEGEIVVAAGYNEDDGVLSSREMYDPKTQQWSRIASMHSKREGCAAVEVEGNIYVLGGQDERENSLSSMEYLPLYY